MVSASLLSILGFLIILGPLVVVHEFGHYIFARIFGVRAEVFSIGFGKKIWSRQMGETELRVSWLPLGGYVKLLGEDREAPLSAEEASRALFRAPAWKRFFIFFGGPLFNFLFAIVVFMAILAIGEPQISNVIGRVVHDSPAAHAGFESGDRVIRVAGKPVKRSEQIIDIISDHPGKALSFSVIHPGMKAPVTLTATPSSEPGYSLYGEQTQVGEIKGLLPAARSTEVGVSNPASPAGKAGIRTGETITSFNGTPVKNFERLKVLYARATPGARITLQLETAKHHPEQAVLVKPSSAASMGKAWGLYSSEMFVDKVIPDSPASRSGIKSGDRIIAVDHQAVYSFFELKDRIQESGKSQGKVLLEWEHQGKDLSVSIVPKATTSRNALLKQTTSYTIGVMPMLTMVEPEMVVQRIWNPFILLYRGTGRMLEFTWRNFVSIEKIITGDVSVATLGGPIMIGKIAGESLAHGLITFLTTMAILSIGLGVLNVLPIPVLDGGHLLLLAIEAIRRKPLKVRTMEIIQSIGLSAILLLMVLVMRNDITRLFP